MFNIDCANRTITPRTNREKIEPVTPSMSEDFRRLLIIARLSTLSRSHSCTCGYYVTYIYTD